jgi:hypothetical protein
MSAAATCFSLALSTSPAHQQPVGYASSSPSPQFTDEALRFAVVVGRIPARVVLPNRSAVVVGGRLVVALLLLLLGRVVVARAVARLRVDAGMVVVSGVVLGGVGGGVVVRAEKLHWARHPWHSAKPDGHRAGGVSGEGHAEQTVCPAVRVYVQNEQSLQAVAPMPVP